MHSNYDIIILSYIMLSYFESICSFLMGAGKKVEQKKVRIAKKVELVPLKLFSFSYQYSNIT